MKKVVVIQMDSCNIARMTTFIYKDYSKHTWVYPSENELSGHWEYPIIFQTQAETITEADKQFELAMGYKAEKTKHIGCMCK